MKALSIENLVASCIRNRKHCIEITGVSFTCLTCGYKVDTRK